MASQNDAWRRLAAAQEGLLTRSQLAACGINWDAVDHRVRSDRWRVVASNVVATTTGELTVHQRRWAAVLHGGEGALLAGIDALQHAGLERWERSEIEVLVPYEHRMPSQLPGVRYRRSRRDLRSMRHRRSGVPRCRVEPAALLFAARQRNERTTAGLLHAVIQQRLTTPEALLDWLERLAPLRRSQAMRVTLRDAANGIQSVAERDVKVMCVRFGLVQPRRQVKRRDASGRERWTDCEWVGVHGRKIVLEVDGAFHMETEHWEDDMKRQRALAASDRVTVRCSAREVRETPEDLARDLIRAGVPPRL